MRLFCSVASGQKYLFTVNRVTNSCLGFVLHRLRPASSSVMKIGCRAPSRSDSEDRTVNKVMQ